MTWNNEQPSWQKNKDTGVASYIAHGIASRDMFAIEPQ